MSNEIEWKMVKLGDLCQIKDGTHQTPHYVEVGKPFYSVENITNNEFIHTKYISESEHERLTSTYKIEKSDVLMTRIGSIGVCKYVDWDVDASFYVSLALLKCNKSKINPKYLVCYSQTKKFREEILSHSLQFAIPMKINLGKISDVQVAIPYKNGTPDLETQSLIAQKLGDMDSLISAKEKLLAKKRNLKTAAMQKLIKDEESENWKKVKVGDITQVFSGGTPSTEHPEYWNGDIPWMNSGELNLKIVNEVEGRITDLGLKSSSTHWIPTGCVLIGLAGQGKTRGTAAYNTIPLCTNQSIAAIYPNEKYFDSKFLYFYFDTQYEQLRELSSGGGGRGGLNKTHLLKYEIPIPCTIDGNPDIFEQKRIASILSDMDLEISSIEKEIMKLQNLKTAMMQKMFCFTKEDE